MTIIFCISTNETDINLASHGITRDLSVVVIDLKHDKSIIVPNTENTEIFEASIIVPNTENTEIFEATSHRKKNHTCYTCMSKFSTSEDLEIHKFVHYNSESEDDKDGEKYYYKKNSKNKKVTEDTEEKAVEIEQNDSLNLGLSKNLDEEITKEFFSFKCCTCEVNFKNFDEFNFHEPKDICRYYCVLCKRKFKIRQSFANHILQLHSSSQIDMNASFICIVCSAKFSTVNEFKEHEKSHQRRSSSEYDSSDTVASENQYKCCSCNAFFKNVEEFNSHPPTDSCTFFCALCKRQIKYKHSFEKHILKHTGLPYTLYKCELCTFKFRTVFRLKKHQRKIHNRRQSKESDITITEVIETPETKDSDNFTCDLCYDIFDTNLELENHTVLHQQFRSNSENSMHLAKQESEIEVVDDRTDKHEVITTIKRRNSNLNIDQTKDDMEVKLKGVVSTKLNFGGEQKTQSPEKPLSLELKKTGPFSFAFNYKDTINAKLTFDKDLPSEKTHSSKSVSDTDTLLPKKPRLKSTLLKDLGSQFKSAPPNQPKNILPKKPIEEITSDEKVKQISVESLFSRSSDAQAISKTKDALSKMLDSKLESTSPQLTSNQAQISKPVSISQIKQLRDIRILPSSVKISDNNRKVADKNNFDNLSSAFPDICIVPSPTKKSKEVSSNSSNIDSVASRFAQLGSDIRIVPAAPKNSPITVSSASITSPLTQISRTNLGSAISVTPVTGKKSNSLPISPSVSSVSIASPLSKATANSSPISPSLSVVSSLSKATNSSSISPSVTSVSVASPLLKTTANTSLIFPSVSPVSVASPLTKATANSSFISPSVSTVSVVSPLLKATANRSPISSSVSVTSPLSKATARSSPMSPSVSVTSPLSKATGKLSSDILFFPAPCRTISTKSPLVSSKKTKVSSSELSNNSITSSSVLFNKTPAPSDTPTVLDSPEVVTRLLKGEKSVSDVSGNSSPDRSNTVIKSLYKGVVNTPLSSNKGTAIQQKCSAKSSEGNELSVKQETLKSFGIYFEDTIVIDDSDEEINETGDQSLNNKNPKEHEKSSNQSNSSLAEFQKYLDNFTRQISADSENFIAKCDSCAEVFYENSAVIQHSQRRVGCKECKEKFCLATELKEHYCKIHNK